MQDAPFFRLRHVAPPPLSAVAPARLLPFGKGKFSFVLRAVCPLALPLPPFLGGCLVFPRAVPPATPLQNPLSEQLKRLILWGGLFRGKTHFRGGNLALLSPLRGGHGSIARLAAWRVCPKRHPLEKGKRKGKQDRQPPQRRNMRFGAARKLCRTHSRVKGAKHRKAACP